MIILHEAKRIDNNEKIVGFLTKMWGQYHITKESDENTAYPVEPSTIKPHNKDLKDNILAILNEEMREIDNTIALDSTDGDTSFELKKEHWRAECEAIKSRIKNELN